MNTFQWLQQADGEVHIALTDTHKFALFYVVYRFVGVRVCLCFLVSHPKLLVSENQPTRIERHPTRAALTRPLKTHSNSGQDLESVEFDLRYWLSDSV